MSVYKDIVARYVAKLGQTKALRLGEPAGLASIDKDSLTTELRAQYRHNQILIWIASALWVVLFGIGIYFALYYRDNLKGLAVALGGNLMVLSAVMIALRRLWLDSSVIGALLAILPSLSAADAAKVITSFYYNAIDSKGPNAKAIQAEPATQVSH